MWEARSWKGVSMALEMWTVPNGVVDVLVSGSTMRTSIVPSEVGFDLGDGQPIAWSDAQVLQLGPDPVPDVRVGPVCAAAPDLAAAEAPADLQVVDEQLPDVERVLQRAEDGPKLRQEGAGLGKGRCPCRACS